MEVFDNLFNVPITFQLNNGTGEGGNGSLDLVLDFPHFTSSFLYDSDFSITLVGSSGSGDGGSCGSLVPLLSHLALIIPAIFFVMVAGVLSVGFILQKRLQHMRAKADSGAVSWTPDTL